VDDDLLGGDWVVCLKKGMGGRVLFVLAVRFPFFGFLGVGPVRQWGG